jgi:hypothetical protein
MKLSPWAFVLVTLCLSAYAAAQTAQWGQTRFIRVNADRIVLLTKKGSFDLRRDAAWDIPDAGQKTAYRAWAQKAGLPTDLGQVVTDLPTDREVPLRAEIVVSVANDAASLALQPKDGQPAEATLAKTKVWAMDEKSKLAFESFSKTLHASTSGLLVALSGMSGKVSEPEALAKLLHRGASSDGFFTVVGGKSAIWTHASATKPSATVQPNSSPVDKPQTSQTEVKPQKSETPSWALPAGIGAVALVGCAFAFGHAPTRKRLIGAFAKGETSREPAFHVGAHERELIMKVREEGQKNPPPLNAPYSVEEFAVGRVLDRYRNYDTLVRERDAATSQAEAFQSYKQFQDEHDAFEAKFRAAKEALAQRESELGAAQSDRKAVQDKLKQAEQYVKSLESQLADQAKSLDEAEALVREVGEWGHSVAERLNAQATKIHHE